MIIFHEEKIVHWIMSTVDRIGLYFTITMKRYLNFGHPNKIMH